MRNKAPPGANTRCASCQSRGLKILAMAWQLLLANGKRAMLATNQVVCALRLQACFTASREISKA